MKGRTFSKRLTHKQLALIAAGACTVIFTLMGLCLAMVISRDFETLDIHHSKDDAKRLLRTFQDKFEALPANIADWGNGDAAYEYVTKGSPRFVADNLMATPVNALNLSLMAYLDVELNPLVIKLWDGKLRKWREATLNEVPFLAKDAPLVRRSDIQPLGGFVRVGNDLGFGFAQAIHRSDGAEPAVGRLVVVQRLDEDFLARLSKQMLMKISFMPLEAIEKVSPAHEQTVPFLGGWMEVFHETVAVYIPLRDIAGDTLAYLVADLPRDIAINGRESLRICLLIYACMALLVSGGVAALLLSAMAKERLGSLEQDRERLAASESYLRALLDSIPGNVAWIDRSLTYVGVNKRLAEAFGSLKVDFVGRKIGFMNIDETPVVKDVMEEFFQHKDRFRQFECLVRQDGKVRKFVTTMAKYDQGDKLVLVSVDVTAAWEMEAQALKDRQLAIHASRLSSLGEMAGGIAHEINNPLAIIHAATRQLARRMRVQGSDAGSEALMSKIENTVVRISKIVQGLRLFARDGQQEPLVEISARHVIEDALALCTERFRNHGIRIEMARVTDDVPIYCRPVQVGQVLINLLNNAFDAVSNLEHPWVRIETTEIGSYVGISVIDAGLGIAPAVAMRMMDPFFTTKPVGKGTGLGLGIAKSIVQDHGGDLSYREASGHTCFMVTLPKRRWEGALGPRVAGL